MRQMKLLMFCLVLCLGSQRTCPTKIDKDKSYATSVVGMTELLTQESRLLQQLSDYAEALQKKVDILKEGVERMREENSKSQEDPEKYLANPLNAFSLIRRMHSDWVDWELFMSKDAGEDHIRAVSELRKGLLTENDLFEAANAVQRIQETYNLTVSDMIAGILNGTDYNVKLSSLDSYTIGYILFKQNITYPANVWLYNSLMTHKDSEIYNVLGFSESNILELYAEGIYKQDRFADTITLLDKALALKPNDAKLLRRKREVEHQKLTDKKPIPMQPTEIVPSAYELACRGVYRRPQPSRLHCRYNTTTSPFLTLAPFKTEEVNLDPYMILFHDVVYDNEIAELKEMARPTLERALVVLGEEKRAAVSWRTSKFTWLRDEENTLTRRLNQRIADMTGFNLKDSEMIQVMNYGIGGHYTVHPDYFNCSQHSTCFDELGDRISTVLFYMSDVEQGGATAFPYLKTSVFPRKGMAIMWYNLNNAGDVDQRTQHAACPVILGSKWVFNKWIREPNQFRRRPCYAT